MYIILQYNLKNLSKMSRPKLLDQNLSHLWSHPFI